MAKNPLIEATVIETGEKIQVYKLRNRPGYVDYNDCKTEYLKKELRGLPKK